MPIPLKAAEPMRLLDVMSRSYSHYSPYDYVYEKKNLLSRSTAINNDANVNIIVLSDITSLSGSDPGPSLRSATRPLQCKQQF